MKKKWIPSGRKALVLLTLFGSGAALAWGPGIQLAHDDVDPVTTGITAEQNAYVPKIYIDNGCEPYSAVDDDGNYNGGLSASGAHNGDCDNSPSAMAYARSVCKEDYCGHMYVYYFPKDNGWPFPSVGHRHDMEEIVVWTEDGDVIGAAYSAHGDYSYDEDPRMSEGRVNAVYELDGFTHAFGRISSGDHHDGEIYPAASWENLTPQAQQGLQDGDNFGGSVFAARDDNFLDKINEARIQTILDAGIDFKASDDPETGDGQAEDVNVGGGAVVEDNHSGYNGTGFVNFNSDGGFVEYTEVDGGAGGVSTLEIRYANGSSGRTGVLIINGTSQSFTMDGTGGWSNFAVKTVEVVLNAGETNTIRFESTGSDFGNLDEMLAIEGGSSGGGNDITASDSIGGTGGSEFNDTDYIPDNPTVTEIRIRSGRRIDQVNIRFSEGTYLSHGGNGGSGHSLYLNSGEYVTSLYACKGNKSGGQRVFYVRFTTSEGRTLSGGSSTSDCATYTAPAGKQIAGYHGRAGGEVDRIGVLYSDQ